MRIFRKETVFEAAKARFRWLFEEFPHVVITVSGGKDSTVCFELALQVAREMGRLPLDVFFLDQEAEWQCVIDTVRKIMTNPDVRPLWYQVPFRMSNSTSIVEQWLQSWEPGAEWMRPKEPFAITENRSGEDRFHNMFAGMLWQEFGMEKACTVGGVRAEESPGRRLGLTDSPKYKWVTWGNRMYDVRPHWTFYPIYDWSLSDVWHAIESNGWDYCTPAETPIWMGDYSFKRIDQVKPGDEVIGFTKGRGQRDKLTRATVEGVAIRRAAVVKITLESGRIVRSTPDHKWLRTSAGHDSWQIGPVKVGDCMAFVVDPVLDGLTTEGAWLGLGGRFRSKDRIVSIEPDGEELVYSMQTTTGNYVAWGYASKNCALYSLLYRLGHQDRTMRVSSVMHELSLQTLYYLQEIEPETWEKLTKRMAGIDMAGHLEGEGFGGVSQLPPMFGSWTEYRDYLLEHLITIPKWRRQMGQRFAAMDRHWKPLGITERELCGVQIRAIMSNDHEFVITGQWEVSKRQAIVRAKDPWPE
jgi:predicted phosphoadenosine phosphosulfate sulfurtransferase